MTNDKNDVDRQKLEEELARGKKLTEELHKRSAGYSDPIAGRRNLLKPSTNVASDETDFVPQDPDFDAGIATRPINPRPKGGGGQER